MEVLEKLREFDPDRFNFVRYNETFFDHERIYIEFEMLQMSLVDFQYKKPENVLTLKEIRPILHQVNTYSCGLVSLWLKKKFKLCITMEDFTIIVE